MQWVISRAIMTQLMWTEALFSPSLHLPCLCDPPAGEDPLSDSECDLDSVAGVLKLYFRGLEPPLFPYDSYSQLLECVRKCRPPH